MACYRVLCILPQSAGWNVNPDDAAAIAAAQRMFEEDDEAAQQAGIR